MKYYHISLDVQQEIKEFTPRIPKAVFLEEDKTMPRISLSTSIEGCLSAVPWGGRKLEHVICEFEEVSGQEFTLVFRVYEFEEEQIEKNNIISSEVLVKRGLVLDAENSNEVWVVNQALNPVKTYLAVLTEYDETLLDVFSQEYHLLTDEELEEKIEEGYDIDDFIIAASTRIENAVMEFYPTIEDLPFHVDWAKWNQLCRTMKENNYESTY